MKGRKRKGGRDKGRGRAHWIGIGGDCVMVEGGGGGLRGAEGEESWEGGRMQRSKRKKAA